MGVRGVHVPSASGAVDPAKARDLKRTPQGTPVAKAKQPAAKVTTGKKPNSKKR
jgi:hypothetical protein